MITLAAALTTILVYGWKLADSARVEDVLFLASASLLSEPWRVVTSAFIHQRAPHFAFNLITLAWFGRAVERRYGAGVFSLTFFGALVNAGSGAFTYHQIADRLSYVVGLILGEDK